LREDAAATKIAGGQQKILAVLGKSSPERLSIFFRRHLRRADHHARAAPCRRL